MKTRISLVALSLAVAACGGAPEAADPYADLAEDSILVRFEANPELEEGTCNPNVHYAMRTTEESIRLNVNYEVVDQSLSGSGFAIFNADQSGVATGSSELNIFDPYPLACSELSIRVSDLTCIYMAIKMTANSVRTRSLKAPRCSPVFADFRTISLRA